MGKTPVDDRLRQIVELRRLGTKLDPVAQARLWRLARELRLELDDSVPKVPAARALGISVKALDKWVAKGEIPTLRRPNVGRSQVETDAVLDLLEEVTELRQSGITSRVVATAIVRLREHGRMRRKLRPNVGAAELRRLYEATTSLERLRTAAELSYVQTRLAALGADQ